MTIESRPSGDFPLTRRTPGERLLGRRIPLSLKRICAQELRHARDPAIEAGGGKLLIRTADAIEPRESGLKQRMVVTGFESFQKALATYNSAAYQAALKVLGSAADRDFRIVEGV